MSGREITRTVDWSIIIIIIIIVLKWCFFFQQITPKRKKKHIVALSMNAKERGGEVFRGFPCVKHQGTHPFTGDDQFLSSESRDGFVLTMDIPWTMALSSGL